MTPEEVAAIFAGQLERDERVIGLARALAAATRIEVELVRHMRFELFPASDAGLEANLWFSPLVAERDMLGLSLVPECRDELRRQLTLPENRAWLERAWKVIAGCHTPDGQPGIPPVVSIQEGITYHALAGPASDTPQIHRQRMQIELGTLFNALDEDIDGSLTSWLALALPVLPELARTSDAAIALADKVRARDASIGLENVPRTAQRMTGASPWAGTTVDVGCRRRTDGIEFSVPPADGSHVIKLPLTSPLAIEVQTPRVDGWQTRSIEFEPVPEHVVPDPAPGSRCHITTPTGHRVSLQPTFGSAAPELVVVGLGVGQDAALNALRRAVDDIGWTIERAGQDGASGGRTQRAVLLFGPETADEAATLDTPLMTRLVDAGAPLLAWTARGLEPVRDVRQRTTPIAAGNAPVLAIRPAGEVIATAGPSGIQLWGDRSTVTSSLPGLAVFSFSVAPNRDVLALVSDDDLLRLWWPDRPEPRTLRAHSERLTSAEFSRSGRRLVSTSLDRSAALWLTDAQGARLQGRLRHDAGVNHAVFSPDEATVTTACEDGTVWIWEVESGRRITTLRHDAAARSVAWNVHGDRLVVSAGDEARMWAFPTLERISSLAHERLLQTAAVSRDGRRVATLDVEGIARLWHVTSGALVLPALDPGAGKTRRVPSLAADYPHTPHGLAFGTNDESLLVASSGLASLWSTLTPGPAIGSLEGEGESLDFTRALRVTGKVRRMTSMEPADLAALRRQLLAIDDRTLQLWEARSATEDSPQRVQAQAPDAPAASHDVPARSRRAAVAIIDDGIDVLHEAFLDEDGRSRIVAIWDQRDTSGPSPQGFTYGRFHTAEDIAGYVRRQSVPGTLGRNVNGHGTQVASVAAGRRAGRFSGGLAPEAAIVAVAMGQGSASILDALSFVDQVATRLRMPLAIGLMADVQSGGRDGRSALEIGVDEATQGGRKPGRAVVAPAGNRRGLRQHATVSVKPGATVRLPWTGDGASVQLEVWAESVNSYRFRLTGGAGRSTAWIGDSRPELRGDFKGGGRYAMRLTKRHIDNGDRHLFVRLENLDAVARTKWQLDIEAQHVSASPTLQAWIDPSTGNAEFTAYVSEAMTIAVPATAQSVIAVSAAGINRKTPYAAEFSSLGPTRDGRQKPDVSAPGISVSAARGGTSRDVLEISGTSPAAAHVTGIVALLFEETAHDAANWPTAAQISAALRQTAQRKKGDWDPALGYGVVDARQFIRAFHG